MGYYNETGWRDNVSTFETKNSGLTEPAMVEIGNTGLYGLNFTNNEELMVTHHIDHDVKPGGETYLHVHFCPTAAMAEGETLQWEVHYVAPKGHQQNETFTGVQSTVTITFTAPTGGIQAYEHCIAETTTPIVTPEVDTILLSRVTYLTGTYTGSVFGFMMDMHYEVDRNSTPNKTPNFYN